MTITVGFSGEDEQPVAVATNLGVSSLSIGAAKTIAASLLMVIEHLENSLGERNDHKRMEK